MCLPEHSILVCGCQRRSQPVLATMFAVRPRDSTRAHNPTPTDASVPSRSGASVPSRSGNSRSWVDQLGDSVNDLFNPEKWTPAPTDQQRPDPSVRAGCGAGIVACEQDARWRASTLCTRVQTASIRRRLTSARLPQAAGASTCKCA